MPRITIIGTGYLGLTHAVCLADLGHDVLAIDIDAEKIATAAGGTTPFFEPDLEPLLRKNLDAGRLRFTTSFAEIGAFGQVHFLCVGTPEGEAGQADLSFLHAAADALAPHLAGGCLIAGKSTVPVGTARALRDRIRAAAPAGVDAIFDQVGGQALEEVAPLLADRRKLVSAGDRAAVARLGGSFVARARNQEVLDALAQLVLSGALRPHVTHTFPLAQAAQALRLVEDGHARGKVVVEVAK